MYENLVAWLRDKDFEPICPCGDESICQGKDCAVLQAADAIEELSRDLDSANELVTAIDGAIPRWIPVTERLPAEGHLVLAAFDDVALVAFYGNHSWWEAATFSAFYPTHWMPLPEPPKGGAGG